MLYFSITSIASCQVEVSGAVGPEAMTVQEVSRLLHFERGDLARVERVLAIPALSPEWRRSFEELLAKRGK